MFEKLFDKITYTLLFLSALAALTVFVLTKDDYIIAKVFDTVIKKSDVLEEYDKYNFRNELLKNPVPDKIIRKKALKNKIFEAVLAHEIKRNKIKISKEKISEYAAEIKGEFVKTPELLAIPDFYEIFLLSDETIANIFEYVKFIKKVPSDEKILWYYDFYDTKFVLEDMTRLSQIFISANRDEIKREADKKYKRLPKAEREKKAEYIKNYRKHKAEVVWVELIMQNRDEVFQRYAARISDDKFGAKTGGDAGFFKISELKDNFAAFAAMPPKSISDVLETDAGYYVMRTTDKIYYKKFNPDEVRKMISFALMKEEAEMAADTKTAQASDIFDIFVFRKF